MKYWKTTDVKSSGELETKLNELEQDGRIIFAVLRTTGGFSDHFVIVYYCT
jgi:hypothetical protein